jgi:hypothetical protein
MAVELGRLFDDPAWIALDDAAPIHKAAAR